MIIYIFFLKRKQKKKTLVEKAPDFSIYIKNSKILNDINKEKNEQKNPKKNGRI